MVNANNNSPDCVGYYCPVEFTQDVCITADYRAQFYLLDHISISRATKETYIREEESFNHVDKSYGYDGRNVSFASAYVHELFCNTMLNMVYDNGPLQPQVIIDAVKKAMKKEKRLWYVDDSDNSEKAQKERKRQKQYWDEFNYLKKEIGYIAGQVYLEYGPLTKFLKYVHDSDLKVRTWVVYAPIEGWFLLDLKYKFRMQEAEARKQKARQKRKQKKENQ